MDLIIVHNDYKIAQKRYFKTLKDINYPTREKIHEKRLLLGCYLLDKSRFLTEMNYKQFYTAFPILEQIGPILYFGLIGNSIVVLDEWTILHKFSSYYELSKRFPMNDDILTTQYFRSICVVKIQRAIRKFLYNR